MRINGLRKSKATDEELMLHVRKGDREALAFLYDRYSAALVNFFHKMLNSDKEKAQDFMQDLFLKIIENPFSFCWTARYWSSNECGRGPF